MRVAPVACVGTDLDEVAAQARASARPTHLHPLGQDGAAVQAAAVWLAVHSEPDQPMRVDPVIDAISRVVATVEFQEKLERVRELARSAEPATVLGRGVAALESVPTALLAFLRHQDDVVSAVRFAISVGGDADTIAAMTGAIAGARHGAAGIPQSWINRLENEAQLRSLAAQLRHRRRDSPHAIR
jgi:poly(ADP-ribose) glycohydrolase ARH3